MFDLLSAVPLRVWGLLALTVLGPMAPILFATISPMGRRVGLATRLTTRAVALMGVGFAAMALVATLAVLRTGLQEIRRRHLPAVVALATELGRGHGASPDTVSFSGNLALFRALNPEVGPAAAWGYMCGASCLVVTADPGREPEAEEWARGMIGKSTTWTPDRTAVLGGEMHLVVTAVLRDPVGAPEGALAVTVRAGWVADRATSTALALVALAFGLLLVSGLLTRRLLAETVARRVRDIAGRLRATDPLPLRRTGMRDELGALEESVTRHITDSVERLREADQRALEAGALAARMEATTTLAAGVAHDFSNLMAGVMVNCEILRDEVEARPSTVRALDTVVDCATRGGKLAHQLIAFARGGKYDPTVIDVNVLVEETMRVETHRLPPGIEVTRHLAPDLLRVEADPVQLTQVISNLVRNALEAVRDTGRPGSITVTTANAVGADHSPGPRDLTGTPEVVISVRDSGPGMSPGVRDRVFEPFFTTKEGGRGMGLAATYGIVAHHGGRIALESEEGRGTAFTVHLPATATAAAPRRSTPTGGLAAGADATVLVVDDEAAILTATRRLLQRRGYTVLTAENGQEAVNVAQQATGPIHVILLDLRMPGISGSQAFRLLAKARPEARVVICSGYDLDETAQTMLDQGAVAFVRKPYSMQDLNAAIRTALGHSD